MMLRCAVLKAGVYNLNRIRVSIIEGSKENGESANQNMNHFVNEIRVPDDILVNVKDTSKGMSIEDTIADQNLISFD